MAESKETNPLQNLFVDIKKILEYVVIKDKEAATAAETEESKNSAELWMNAIMGTDNYITYRAYWTFSMFQEVQNNVKYNDFRNYVEKPFSVPLRFQETLREQGRQLFLDQYIEKNDYYRMLNGLPSINDTEKDFIYLSKELQEKFHCDNLPIHEQSLYVQSSYMTTDEYAKVVSENPSKKYLKYLGINKIDIFAARKAKDFDIISYPTGRSDINPNLLNTFSTLYADYREYVMVVLYNPQFENMYANYRTFMGVLIMSFTLMQIGNKAVEAVHDKRYLDDTILHIVLSMYGIPDSLLLPNEIRRDLAINMLKLVREKGTDEVYYDLIQILGYQNVTVSKLMLMKNQKFDINGNPILDKDGNPIYEPKFVQIDLKDTNPYDTIVNKNPTEYDYYEITNADSEWINDSTVKDLIMNKPYTMADSKYITIESEIQQMKYAFESIYFTRLILDNHDATDNFMVNVPELFGVQSISIYDLIVYVLCATCMTNHLPGNIITDEERLLATAGFNFDLNQDAFNEFLSTTKYVDLNRLNKFIENLSVIDKSDINRLFNDVISPMREWLENSIASATTRQEYLEYEAIYKALYTYDINRNPFIGDFKMPLILIEETYGISHEDMAAYKCFYPKSDEIARSINAEYTWMVTLGSGQTIYFYDVLNSNSILDLKDKMGNLIFLKYEDADIGIEVDTDKINELINLIKSLSDDQLNNATFKSFVIDELGNIHSKGEKLPVSIRAKVYKNILIDKITADADGRSSPPTTYIEYLRRKNSLLYELLTKDNRFNNDYSAWINDVMTVITTIESELSIHIKYFEQSALGEELFFKPLLTLIKHFKSSLVKIAKTGLKYVFDDKVDIGGNSNMLKLFDEIKFSIHFATVQSSGYNSQLGLFDAEHSMKHIIKLYDKMKSYKQHYGSGFAAEEFDITVGSMHLSDEVKFMKNGKAIDSGVWMTSEERITEEEIELIESRNAMNRGAVPIDFDAWVDYVKSYIPHE